jgi:hypothetical protein
VSPTIGTHAVTRPGGCRPRPAGIGFFLAALLLQARPSAAQAARDTLPERVVARMFELFDRGEVTERSTLYDSVYFFRDLAVPPPGQPDHPLAMAPEARARAWRNGALGVEASAKPRHRRVLGRLVAGRFVVLHIAVVFDPPNQGDSFEKLEIYEVRNGRIVAEYDGQYVGDAASALGQGK